MVKEWQTFIRKFDDIKEGDVEIFIKDLSPGPRKYDTKHVNATVSRSQETLPDGDILWIRGESGLKHPEPWYIKIHEELNEWVPGQPWENVLDAINKLK
jgi:hypothetical protein